MKNAKLIEIKKVFVRDNTVFSFVDKFMSDINYLQDFDLIQQYNKQDFLVDIATANRINDMFEDEEISIANEKDYKDFQELIFKLEDFGYSEFNVTPE